MNWADFAICRRVTALHPSLFYLILKLQQLFFILIFFLSDQRANIRTTFRFLETYFEFFMLLPFFCLFFRGVVVTVRTQMCVRSSSTRGHYTPAVSFIFPSCNPKQTPCRCSLICFHPPSTLTCHNVIGE